MRDFLLSSKAFLLLFNKNQWPQNPRVPLSQKHQHSDRVPWEQFSSSAAQLQNRTRPGKTQFLPLDVPLSSAQPCPSGLGAADFPNNRTWGGSTQRNHSQQRTDAFEAMGQLCLSLCVPSILRTLSFPAEACHSHTPVLWPSWKRHLCSPQPSKGLSWRQRGC